MNQTKDTISVGNQVNQDGHLATKTSVDQVKSVLISVYATLDGARTEANVSASAIQGKLDIANSHLSGIKDNTAAINANMSGFGNKLDTISGKVQDNTDSTAQRLDKVIDLLDHSGFTPDVGGQSFAGSAAGAEMKGQLETAAAGFAIPSIPTGSLSSWKVTLGTGANGHPWEVDLNLLSYPSLAPFAAWLRNVLVWVSTAIYVMAVTTSCMKRC